MNATQIDRMANAIVSSLAGPAPGLLGCGAVSSATQFTSEQDMDCGEYECGGLANFLCCAWFRCLASFDCQEPAVFSAAYEGSGPFPEWTFECTQTFTCLGEAFSPKDSLCGPLPPP